MSSQFINYFLTSAKVFFNPSKAKLYKYKNYEEYKKIQIEGNVKKIKNCWVTEENISFLSGYIKEQISKPEFGICHGVRRGKEQEWFNKHLQIKMLGTDISPTANQFPNTIEWDFHNVKDEWINKVDFIYSNSFDHSYKPKECLDAWMSCIKKNGLLILEWTTGHVNYNELDPFGATIKGYKKLINKKYKIKKILKAPNNRFWKIRKTYFIVVSHR